MARIILISPPGPYRDTPDPNGLPLGLVMLATMVSDIADVEIIDSWSLALSIPETIERVIAANPDLVGISLPFSFSEKTALEIAHGVKDFKPGIPVIFGGIQASVHAVNLIGTGEVDAVARGEYEFGFRRLVEIFKSDGWDGVVFADIPNLLFEKETSGHTEKGMEFIDNLDSLPIPDFKNLPGFPDKYNARLLTSRGCRFRCPYCASAGYWGHLFRAHSPERVLKELAYLKDNWGIKRVSFSDDTFNHDRKRSIDIAGLLIKSDLEMEWGASMRPELLDENDLRFYVRSGLTGLFLGLESGSEKILRIINRNHDPDKIRALIGLAEDLGVEVHASFMIGLPDEMEADIEATLEYAENLPVSTLGFHIFHPLPGSEYGENPVKYGLGPVFGDDLVGDIDGVAPVNTRHLSPMRILDYYHAARGLMQRRNSPGTQDQHKGHGPDIL